MFFWILECSFDNPAELSSLKVTKGFRLNSEKKSNWNYFFLKKTSDEKGLPKNLQTVDKPFSGKTSINLKNSTFFDLWYQIFH